MTTDQDDLDFQHACSLVGEFLYFFATIESTMDAAIIKLFSLKEETADIITANMDFSRKVNVLKSALLDQLELTDPLNKKTFDGTFSQIREINDARLVVAHSIFEPSGDGVRFKRTVARDGLKKQNPEWSALRFSNYKLQMVAMEHNLLAYVATLRPYHPSLDFSDPRNSQYLGYL